MCVRVRLCVCACAYVPATCIMLAHHFAEVVDSLFGRCLGLLWPCCTRCRRQPPTALLVLKSRMFILLIAQSHAVLFRIHILVYETNPYLKVICVSTSRAASALIVAIRLEQCRISELEQKGPDAASADTQSILHWMNRIHSYVQCLWISTAC